MALAGLHSLYWAVSEPPPPTIPSRGPLARGRGRLRGRRTLWWLVLVAGSLAGGFA